MVTPAKSRTRPWKLVHDFPISVMQICQYLHQQNKQSTKHPHCRYLQVLKWQCSAEYASCVVAPRLAAMILSPLPCCLIPSLCTRMAEQYRRCRATYTPTRHTTRTSVRPLRLLGCPMAVHGSGPLRRRGNVDNVAAAHDFCGAHADCSQQGCGQKMFERLWPVIGRRASFGRYCITTKMTHRGTWCSGIRLLWLSLSVLARQLGRRPG